MTCLSAALDGMPVAQRQLVLATAENMQYYLPEALAASYGHCIDFHTPLAWERAQVFAPVLQEVCRAPTEGARSAAVREVLPLKAEVECLDGLRTAWTSVLGDFVSQTKGLRAEELDMLCMNLCEALNAFPSDMPVRDALVNQGRSAVGRVLECAAITARRATRTSKVGTDTFVDSSLQSGAQSSSTGSTKAS